MDDVSQWFWLVLEQARPNLGRLATWLEVASRAEIEDLAREFRRAKQHVVADYSKGIEVDGVVLPEDATEDFCDWVVAQGRDFWQSAVASRADHPPAATPAFSVTSVNVPLPLLW